MKASALFWRGLFLLAVALLLAGGWLLAVAGSWKQDVLARLAAGAEPVDAGGDPVQVAIRGDGFPVLVVHGAPGGYDQGLALAEAFVPETMRIIAPSRPGYLGTPLGTHLLPRQQAGLLARMLDELGISRVALLAFSGGAPAALSLAAANPSRVAAVVLVSGIVRKLPLRGPEGQLPFPLTVLTALGGDVQSSALAWLSEHDTRRALELALPFVYAGTPEDRARLAETITRDAVQADGFRGLIASVVPVSPREIGTRNDTIQLTALSEEPVLPPGIPVLLVCGAEDPVPTLEDARWLAARAPDAKVLTVEKAGHLPWLGPDGDRAAETVRQFLEAAAE